MWHWSAAVQTTGLSPVHTPPWQVSVWVQASRSSHAVPSGLAGFEHWPVPGSQVPTAWHWSAAAHTTGWLPAHTPLSQVSVWVQALPSLQAVPSGLVGLEHWPVATSHVPVVWH